MLRILLLFLILTHVAAARQLPPGIEDSIMSIKRTWKTKQPFVGAYDPQLKKTDFPQVYKKTNAIAALLREAYPNPAGTEALWYVSVTGEPCFKGGPSPYHVSGIFKYFYYNAALKKILRHEEPGTGATIFVNSFRFLLDDKKLVAQIDQLSPKRIYGVCNQQGEWKGYPVYIINKKFAGYQNYRMILLTRNGQLPWKPVSRLQYLEALRTKWKEDRNKAVKDLEEGLVKAQKMINDLKQTRMDAPVKEKMIATAQSAYEKQLAMKDSYFQAADNLLAEHEARIDAYIRSHSASELDQQAIVDEFVGHYGWQNFAQPPYKDAHQLVYIDQSYFDRSLPSYAPQFITLTWNWMDALASLYFRKQFEENFPVEKLQAILGTK